MLFAQYLYDTVSKLVGYPTIVLEVLMRQRFDLSGVYVATYEHGVLAAAARFPKLLITHLAIAAVRNQQRLIFKALYDCRQFDINFLIELSHYAAQTGNVQLYEMSVQPLKYYDNTQAIVLALRNAHTQLYDHIIHRYNFIPMNIDKHIVYCPSVLVLEHVLKSLTRRKYNPHPQYVMRCCVKNYNTTQIALVVCVYAVEKGAKLDLTLTYDFVAAVATLCLQRNIAIDNPKLLTQLAIRHDDVALVKLLIINVTPEMYDYYRWHSKNVEIDNAIIEHGKQHAQQWFDYYIRTGYAKVFYVPGVDLKHAIYQTVQNADCDVVLINWLQSLTEHAPEMWAHALELDTPQNRFADTVLWIGRRHLSQIFDTLSLPIQDRILTWTRRIHF